MVALHIEEPGECREDQVNAQLGAEVSQHQRTQQGVGDAVGVVKGHEEQRRQAEHRGHGEIRRVAGKPCPLVIRAAGIHGRMLLSVSAHQAGRCSRQA